MNEPMNPVTTARGMGMLHGALLAGLVVIAVVFVGIMQAQGGPVLAPGGGTPIVAYALTGFALSALVMATVVLRPRISPRGSVPPDEYWSTPLHRTAALLLWVVTEAAGWIGAVGYLLTGNPVPAAVGALAIASLVLQSPGRLTGD
jgi:hypothetical protein